MQLNKVLADAYSYVGDHENAIRNYLELVLFEKPNGDHIDYLVWIGQECIAADQSEKAGMFLREALVRLGNDSEDSRAVRARELLT